MLNTADLACACPTRVLTRRTFRNGSHHWLEQCITCGAHTKSMKAETAKQRIDGGEKWENFDETRAELFREHLRRKNQEERMEAKESRVIEYQEYLKSDEWREKRAKVMRRAGGVCEGCMSRPAMQVHHKTYVNIGRELLFELVALCSVCHAQAHCHE